MYGLKPVPFKQSRSKLNFNPAFAAEGARPETCPIKAAGLLEVFRFGRQ
jgi:hypothetical protein